MHCQRKYLPEPKQPCFPMSLRERTVEMYVGDNNNTQLILLG